MTLENILKKEQANTDDGDHTYDQHRRGCMPLCGSVGKRKSRGKKRVTVRRHEMGGSRAEFET